MARTRSIKPGFFDNDILGGLSPLTRLLFIGLWVIADREGRLEDRPKKIKKTILGYDDVDTDGVEKMLQSLHDTGFILRYHAEGDDYIQVINFVKHQNPHMKEKPSEIPPPPGEGEGAQEYAPGTGSNEGKAGQSTRQAPDKYGAKPEQAQPGEEEDENEEDGEEEPRGENNPQTAMERRFELFWTAYPKKKAKKAAWAAFKKAKPNEELFVKIMNAIGRARTSFEWQKEGGQYIPNPATWLNGGCWDDEYKEVPSNGERGGHSNPNNQQSQSNAPTGAGKPDALSGFKSADDDEFYRTDE